VSFNTTVRQTTEMFQWPKCLSKNDRNVSAKETASEYPWKCSRESLGIREPQVENHWFEV